MSSRPLGAPPAPIPASLCGHGLAGGARSPGRRLSLTGRPSPQLPTSSPIHSPTCCAVDPGLRSCLPQLCPVPQTRHRSGPSEGSRSSGRRQQLTLWLLSPARPTVPSCVSTCLTEPCPSTPRRRTKPQPHTHSPARQQTHCQLDGQCRVSACPGARTLFWVSAREFLEGVGIQAIDAPMSGPGPDSGDLDRADGLRCWFSRPTGTDTAGSAVSSMATSRSQRNLSASPSVHPSTCHLPTRHLLSIHVSPVHPSTHQPSVCPSTNHPSSFLHPCAHLSMNIVSLSICRLLLIYLSIRLPSG